MLRSKQQNRGARGGVEGRSKNQAQESAERMLDAFASVGADKFDLTLTDLTGEKIAFFRGLPLSRVRKDLPSLLENTERRQQNPILRPLSSSTLFVQLDDLDPDSLRRVSPVSFLQLETSPGNGQAWIALPIEENTPDLARRIRKACGADVMASGSTRIAGSLNHKDKYAPDFPRIAITHLTPGQLVTTEQLDQLRLIAPPEEPKRYAPAPRFSTGPKVWPDYEQCLRGAPPNHDKTGPDRSRADFVWCMTALRWGWSIEDTAARLMHLSTKAQERKHGQRYADNTARSAARALERSGQQCGR